MSSPSITDSHCHLDFADFDGNLEEIVKNGTIRCRQDGYNCTQLQDEPKVRSIVKI